jgi:hypothetical protein
MKIISKVKDYFHYLQGVNGIDEKIVLDYKEYHLKKDYVQKNRFYKRTFFICDYWIELLEYNGNFYFGKEIEQFAEINRWYSNEQYYYIKGERDLKVLKEPYLCTGDTMNDIHNCPLLIKTGFLEFEKFPILKDYQFHKVYDAQTLWNMIYDWMSKDKQIIDKRTNKEKILSNGFDYKESFRNIK